jgi:DNA-binding NtrC family response regulator
MGSQNAIKQSQSRRGKVRRPDEEEIARESVSQKQCVMKTKIYVVEDDDFTRNMIEESLKQSIGGLVKTFGSTKTALEALYAETPDVLILDYHISAPGEETTTGAELFKKIKEDIQIPVIFVSAQKKIHTAVECLEMGAADYVSKSSDDFLSELMHAISNVLEFRKLSSNKWYSMRDASKWKYRSTVLGLIITVLGLLLILAL